MAKRKPSKLEDYELSQLQHLAASVFSNRRILAMTEIVKSSSAKSEALFDFLGDILKRAETSTCLLDFTELELHKTAAAIQELELVRIKSRHYHLRWYKSCFVGKDFVDALYNRICLFVRNE